MADNKAETKEFLTHYAKLICSECVDQGITLLKVNMKDAGVYMNGQIVATDQCLSEFQNFIVKFKTCKSPKYEAAVRARISFLNDCLHDKDITDQDKAEAQINIARYEAALESSTGAPLHPCLLAPSKWTETETKYVIACEQDILKQVDDAYNYFKYEFGPNGAIRNNAVYCIDLAIKGFKEVYESDNCSKALKKEVKGILKKIRLIKEHVLVFFDSVVYFTEYMVDEFLEPFNAGKSPDSCKSVLERQIAGLEKCKKALTDRSSQSVGFDKLYLYKGNASLLYLKAKVLRDRDAIKDYNNMLNMVSDLFNIDDLHTNPTIDRLVDADSTLKYTPDDTDSILEDEIKSYKEKGKPPFKNIFFNLQECMKYFICSQSQAIFDAYFPIYIGDKEPSQFESRVDELIGQLKGCLPKLKVREAATVLTTDSHLICHFGGDISVIDSGQWFIKARKKVRPNLETLVDNIMQYLAGYQPEDVDELFSSEYIEPGSYLEKKAEENKKLVEATQERKMGAFPAIWEAINLLNSALSESPPQEIQYPAVINIRLYPQNYLNRKQAQQDGWLACISAIFIAAGIAAGLAAASPEVALGITGAGALITIPGIVANAKDDKTSVNDVVAGADTAVGVGTLDDVVEVIDKVFGEDISKVINNPYVDVAGQALAWVDFTMTLASMEDIMTEQYTDYYIGRMEIIVETKEACFTFYQDYSADGEASGDLQVNAKGFSDDTTISERAIALKPGLYAGYVGSDADLKEVIDPSHPDLRTYLY